MDIKTKSGFKCVIDEDVLDNWELLVAFREIDKGDVGAIVDVAPKFLGEAQYKKLVEHVRKKHGSVKATIMVQEISEIMNASNASKNS